MPASGKKSVEGAASAVHPKKGDRAKAKAAHPKGSESASVVGARPRAASGPTTAPAGAWGQDLAYPEWLRRWMPAVHSGFNGFNRYLGVPALRMGLGRYMSNPLTGYLMLLRTRGRTSGEMRDAPLAYAIVGEYVYCIAGFGRQAHWFQNVLADPHVEVTLTSRAFSGIAQEVTDVEERRRALPPLMRSMGVIAGMMGMGNAWRDSPDEMLRKCEGMPLVRIRATGIAPGPEDPGGRYWIVPLAASAVVTVWWLRSRRSPRKG
jgi:deazaflavin-dependent oxidoreductase (nitroreductase family)